MMKAKFFAAALVLMQAFPAMADQCLVVDTDQAVRALEAIESAVRASDARIDYLSKSFDVADVTLKNRSMSEESMRGSNEWTVTVLDTTGVTHDLDLAYAQLTTGTQGAQLLSDVAGCFPARETPAGF